MANRVIVSLMLVGSLRQVAADAQPEQGSLRGAAEKWESNQGFNVQSGLQNGVADEAEGLQRALQNFKGLPDGVRFQDPKQVKEEGKTVSKWPFFLFHLFFAIFYFYMVVSKYPKLRDDPPMESRQLQDMSAPKAMTKASPQVCLVSWCCPQARAALTMDKTEVLSFWVGWILMMCCPFCTLCMANAQTDMNNRLGGTKQSFIMSCLCTWFCSCCVVAQDAESLDICTEVKSGICSVEPRQQRIVDAFE